MRSISVVISGDACRLTPEGNHEPVRIPLPQANSRANKIRNAFSAESGIAGIESAQSAIKR